MCIVPKLSLIDSWLWFHLFLNYLYLVALLNLKVSYAFMFCYSMRDKMKTICYVFPYDLNTCLTFIVSLFMIFSLCLFHVITWLLSFLLSRLCLLCPCFKFFDPSTQCLIRWSRLWWCMSPQKLFFCYHLPTRGRAGVKLGDAWYVSNVSIIFDAPCLFYTICFMFCLHFVAFLCDFQN
jgi:hypothetical protein